MYSVAFWCVSWLSCSLSSLAETRRVDSKEAAIKTENLQLHVLLWVQSPNPLWVKVQTVKAFVFVFRIHRWTPYPRRCIYMAGINAMKCIQIATAPFLNECLTSLNCLSSHCLLNRLISVNKFNSTSCSATVWWPRNGLALTCLKRPQG